jgi:hypothetical protein
MPADHIPETKTDFIRPVKDFIRKAWPINWSNLKNFTLIRQVLVASPYPFKAALLILTTILIISTGFLGFGFFLVLTKEVPGNGGIIREVVVGTDAKVFNPVLEMNTVMEKKVVELIYHPLYEISYPDFVNTSNEPVLTPILLAKTPEWQDLSEIKPENRYKRLKFTLKDGIKWTNNSKITSSDVEYTFERLKEDRGNSVFRLAFANVTFEKISDKEFDLVSQNSAPKLMYSANFRPISKTFYEGLSTERLYADPRSFKPTVTSGFYSFSDGTVKDPDTGNNRENPFRDQSTGLIQGALLDRNKVQNYNQAALADQYYIQKVNELFDTGGNIQSVERLSKSGKVDVFQRNLASDLQLSSSEVSSKLKMNQTTIPSNTYFSLFLNIKLDNATGYFINQFLRKYVICSFMNYKLDAKYKSQLEEIPANKKLLPINFGEVANSGCPENPDTILNEAKSGTGASVYTIKFDPTTSIKRVLLFKEEIRINLVGPPSSEPLLSDVQSYFLSIGIPADLISEPDRVASSLQNKSYNAVLLPVTYTNRDPYSLFGSSGQDIIRAGQNNRILSYKLEENLKKYSDSNLTDEASKKVLIDFFSKEYVSVNLFRSKQEINYTSKVANLKEQLPSLITFNEDMYNKLPNWYVNTKRQFIFQ